MKHLHKERASTAIDRGHSNRKKRTFSLGVERLESRCVPSADMVLQWNAVALDAVKNDYAIGHTPDQGGPTRAARALAIVHMAMYDAADVVDGSYDPYLIDGKAQKGTSLDAAVAQAGHDTLAALFPQQIADFDAALTLSMTGINPGAAEKGKQLGSFMARMMMAARQKDGSDAMMSFTPNDQPGAWQPDPLHPTQSALTPDWGAVAPFVGGDEFAAPPPPALTSKEYAEAFDEVKSLGGDGITTPTKRTAEQTIIGQFWGYDGSPGIGVPPRLYNQIARVIAIQQKNSEMQNARLFALVNMAMADAGIAAWQAKYEYDFWRPVTAIRDAAADGNPRTKADSGWTPLGVDLANGGGVTNLTPPFPAYVSGHATFGAATFRMLRDFYGTDKISFSFTSDEFNGATTDSHGLPRPRITRSYTSFSQAAEENGQSRIYLGIHWKFDKVDGIAMGNRIGDYVYAHSLLPHSARGGCPVVLFVMANFGPAPSLQTISIPYAGPAQPMRALSDGLSTGGPSALDVAADANSPSSVYGVIEELKSILADSWSCIVSIHVGIDIS